MKIGVPKEIKPQENRIGLTPGSVKILTCRKFSHYLFEVNLLKNS